jgi:hypothetical protein
MKQSPVHLAEIIDLEVQLRHFEKSLDQSIRNNEIFAKTKIIFQEMKIIYSKLLNLKKNNGANERLFPPVPTGI